MTYKNALRFAQGKLVHKNQSQILKTQFCK